MRTTQNDNGVVSHTGLAALRFVAVLAFGLAVVAFSFFAAGAFSFLAAAGLALGAAFFSFGAVVFLVNLAAAGF